MYNIPLELILDEAKLILQTERVKYRFRSLYLNEQTLDFSLAFCLSSSMLCNDEFTASITLVKDELPVYSLISNLDKFNSIGSVPHQLIDTPNVFFSYLNSMCDTPYQRTVLNIIEFTKY